MSRQTRHALKQLLQSHVQTPIKSEENNYLVEAEFSLGKNNSLVTAPQSLTAAALGTLIYRTF